MNKEDKLEHIEQKIKLAAENNPQVFEEASWVKMETLLDKENSKKRFFWFWFFVAFIPAIGIGFFIFLHNPFDTKGNSKEISKDIIKEQIKQPLDSLKADIKYSTKKLDTLETNTAINFKSKTNTQNIVNTLSSIYKKATTKITIKSNKASKDLNKKEQKNRNQKNKYIQKATSNIIVKAAKADAENEVEIEKQENNDSLKKDITIINKNKNEKIKKDTTIITYPKTTTSIKEKENKFLSKFYFVSSAGADIGSVKLLSFNNSKISLKYGLGIGYNFSKKISIQTGFYASSKKYIASPLDYTIKAGSYASQWNITKVDAACLIYEIPITIRYNFWNRKSFTMYAATGLSSYIMKTEDYNYFYTRYNMEYLKAYSYSGNKHLFSNANFAIGFEKSMSKKIAFQLEPCISIPLNGVGEGSVKLYSSSILFGIKYSPFKK